MPNLFLFIWGPMMIYATWNVYDSLTNPNDEDFKWLEWLD